MKHDVVGELSYWHVSML